MRQPFDAPGIFRFLASRAVKGVEAAEVTKPGRLRYARTLLLTGGPGAIEVVATRTGQSGWQLRAFLELSDAGDATVAVEHVRRLLDLDTDPPAIDLALCADPALAPLVAQTPGIRVPGATDPHEIIVRAVVGQQISVAAARTHLSRLAAQMGSTHTSGFDGLSRRFPVAEQIAKHLPAPTPDGPLDPTRPLRLPRRSIHTVLSIARALSDGDLIIDGDAEPDLLRQRLVAQPGIGPWTAAYVTMRLSGDPDAWLRGDVALVAGAKNIGLIGRELSPAASHTALADRATAWSPWRSYAAMHLWRAASGPARR